ncbi:Gfo/Idh/MocA family protein [Synoicihabitans lomoniglobus]|uniref:Gfo/Idh/MocA family oxidoreductase n=1 Tax=Synoicihabitans lomoniglobus TaxID=2909285 RepID=A0AAE9ZV79_9BACT|nr:Gfo/Idh/MocA family oxidoreductase [Opitutaceae bacterium LMO-M01]WED63689.1 Gfo/Idh/MocA family oxidoreductase [Opitutaceae bacterium LMO-M01]
MNVALLGLQHPHSALLLATFQELPEISRIDLWDSDPSVVANPPLPRCAKATAPTSALDAVLAQPDLTFVMVCVRHDQSAAIALQVIAAGKHLLIEKPVGLNAVEVQRVQAAADRAGVVAAVLYLRRHHPCIVAARELVNSGALGAPLSIESRFITTQVKFRDPASWLFNRAQAGGGILLWLGCHNLDMMQYVAGEEIVEVSAMMATRSGEAIDVEDTVSLSFKFRSGAIGTFNAGYALAYSGSGYDNVAGYDCYFAYYARHGKIVWPDLVPRLLIERPPRDGESPAREETFTMPPSQIYGARAGETFFAQFFAAMQGRADSPAPLSAALQTARIVEAAAESSRQGRFMPVASPVEIGGSATTY